MTHSLVSVLFRVLRSWCAGCAFYLCFGFPAAAQTVDDLDRDNGWGDVKLGSLSREVPGLVIQEKSADGRHMIAVRNKETLRHGNVPLAKISYFFFDDVLWKIKIQVADVKDFRALERLLAARYAKGGTSSSGDSFDGSRIRISFYESEREMSDASIASIGYAKVWMHWSASQSGGSN